MFVPHGHNDFDMPFTGIEGEMWTDWPQQTNNGNQGASPPSRLPLNSSATDGNIYPSPWGHFELRRQSNSLPIGGPDGRFMTHHGQGGHRGGMTGRRVEVASAGTDLNDNDLLHWPGGFNVNQGQAQNPLPQQPFGFPPSPHANQGQAQAQTPTPLAGNINIVRPSYAQNAGLGRSSYSPNAVQKQTYHVSPPGPQPNANRPLLISSNSERVFKTSPRDFDRLRHDVAQPPRSATPPMPPMPPMPQDKGHIDLPRPHRQPSNESLGGYNGPGAHRFLGRTPGHVPATNKTRTDAVLAPSIELHGDALAGFKQTKVDFHKPAKICGVFKTSQRDFDPLRRDVAQPPRSATPPMPATNKTRTDAVLAPSIELHDDELAGFKQTKVDFHKSAKICGVKLTDPQCGYGAIIGMNPKTGRIFVPPSRRVMESNLAIPERKRNMDSIDPTDSPSPERVSKKKKTYPEAKLFKAPSSSDNFARAAPSNVASLMSETCIDSRPRPVDGLAACTIDSDGKLRAPDAEGRTDEYSHVEYLLDSFQNSAGHSKLEPIFQKAFSISFTGTGSST
ncbi:hypothetical protein K504DRAFT_508425 [Pleomassaria siparia CBS 279.74]|uniref:Uncharacterized protein n=1 Tax=Pleomassaria siparia CBS 279.74 TaxID=1314801 RepID=A0A6G1JQV3_9PLEO|nr:hypothetical protein K504DRAFT_508425 [Pleomassaria siparia CBS 279.74]